MFISSLTQDGKPLNIVARVTYTLPLVYIQRTWWCNMLVMVTFMGYVFSAIAFLHHLWYEAFNAIATYLKFKSHEFCILQYETESIAPPPVGTDLQMLATSTESS